MPKKPKRSPARAATCTPIRPDGWQTLSGAISWIALGTAEADWDARLYIGASLWPLSAPDDVVIDVAPIADGRPVAGLGQAWALHQIAEVAAQAKAPAGPPAARRFMAVSPARPTAARAQLDHEEIVASAHKHRARLTGPHAAATYQALWRAAEDLRRALAEDKLAAFGRRPSSRGRGAREQIPPADFSAPITLSPRGIIPAVEGATFDDDLEPVWVDVLLNGAELMRVWPDLSAGRPTATDEPAPTADDGARVAMPPAAPADDKVTKEAEVHAGARAWMTKNVDRPGSWKREAAIPRCAADVGCTWRAATLAWDMLPKELKMRRGRPQKGRSAEE